MRASLSIEPRRTPPQPPARSRIALPDAGTVVSLPPFSAALCQLEPRAVWRLLLEAAHLSKTQLLCAEQQCRGLRT